MNNYIINQNQQVEFEGHIVLSNEEIVEAIHFANDALLKLNETTLDFDINIFETLGLRNLSGLVGEYFAHSISRISNGRLESNLHQDGYPDLLLTDTQEKRQYFDSLYTIQNGRKHPVSKEVFSPYKFGGIEVKATCGSTPPATQTPKPLVGEQRIQLLTDFDWKAHHRDTNNLLAILWDFIDQNPTIVACFYCNDLIQDDWGKVVKPSDNGGRTTSVSVMKFKGVKKMCRNWVAVLDNELYIDKLANKKWIGHKIK